MRQRKLGNTGLIVSEIGMGTWELGGREWLTITHKYFSMFYKHHSSVAQFS